VHGLSHAAAFVKAAGVRIAALHGQTDLWKAALFEFLEHLPNRLLKNNFIQFCHPCEAANSLNYEPAALYVPEPVSWADTER
jgi:alpha-amylase/alpha-mannosidase (GH57 family)